MKPPPLNDASLIGFGPGDEARRTYSEGTIVIRMNLSGNTSTEIIAGESATEERLRERLRAARPILDLLDKSLKDAPLGAGW